MNCPPQAQWSLLSATLLSETEAAALRAHAANCPPCARQLRAARQDHVTLQRSFEVFDRQHDALREHLMASVADLPTTAPTRPARRGARRWPGAITMSIKQHKVRWAALTLAPAACLFIAIPVLLSTGSAIAFADVVQRLRQARTMVCQFEGSHRVEQLLDLGPEAPVQPGLLSEATSSGKLFTYSDGNWHAARRDVLETSVATNPGEDAARLEAPYTEWTLPDRHVVRRADGRVEVVEYTGDSTDRQLGTNLALNRWLRRLVEVCDSPDRELGRQIVAGRETVGFEIAGWRLGYGTPPQPGEQDATAGESWFRLWVDVETKLPVRTQVHWVSTTLAQKMTLTGVYDDMRWDVPLDRAQFDPPPATSANDVRTLHVAPASEAAFIEAIREWRASTERLNALLDSANREPPEMLLQILRPDCINPPSVDSHELLNLFASRRAGLVAAERARQLARGETPDDSPHAAEIKSSPGTAVWMYYNKLLMDGRDPVYEASALGPDEVLLRWRLDGRHERVIYGDLRAETLPVEHQQP